MPDLKAGIALFLLLAGGPSLSGAAAGKPLPAPQGLSITVDSNGLEFSWGPVTGAACYRLAVFPEKDKDARPLAAIWIKGTSYLYGQDAFIKKIGSLPSKEPEALRLGAPYRWIVAAAAPGGLRKSDWASGRFEYTAPKGKTTPSATPTPMGGALTVNPDSETPTAGTLTPTAVTQISMAGTSVATGTVTPTPEPENVLKEGSTSGEHGLELAQQLLKEKKWEAAQKEFKRLSEEDPRNFDAFAGLGDAYIGLNMRVEGVEAYRQALSLKDDERISKWLKDNVRTY